MCVCVCVCVGVPAVIASAMSGASSVEYRTLEACTLDLELALKDPVRDLVHALHRRGFITQDDYDNIVDPRSLLTGRQKAGCLVDAIKKKVCMKRERYLDFIDILKKQPSNYYDEIIEILQQCCKFFKLQMDKNWFSTYWTHCCIDSIVRLSC